MEKLSQKVKDLIFYIKSKMARKKREKKQEEEDPFIYPHF
jgi:hypothetical protein